MLFTTKVITNLPYNITILLYYDFIFYPSKFRSNALYNQGNNKLAIQYYDKALAIDPHYTDAIYDRDTALNGSSSNVSALNGSSRCIGSS